MEWSSKEEIPYKGGLSSLNEIVCTGSFSKFIKIVFIFFFLEGGGGVEGGQAWRNLLRVKWVRSRGSKMIWKNAVWVDL